MYSTGNYIQYPGKKTYWKRIFERMYICVLEKEMAIHSSTIAWKIPWTEEPGRL